MAKQGVFAGGGAVMNS